MRKNYHNNPKEVWWLFSGDENDGKRNASRNPGELRKPAVAEMDGGTISSKVLKMEK